MAFAEAGSARSKKKKKNRSKGRSKNRKKNNAEADSNANRNSIANTNGKSKLRFLGEEAGGYEHLDEGDDASVIHMDSDDDDDVMHDDDVDIGFRKHHYSNNSSSNNSGNSRKKRRQRSKEEAIYGVFMGGGDNDDNRNHANSTNSSNVMPTAPLFVKSKTAIKEEANQAAKSDIAGMFQKASKPDAGDKSAASAMTFHKASKSTDEEKKEGDATTNGNNDNNDNEQKKVEEEEEDRKTEAEQKAADDRFLSLLNKATARSKSKASAKLREIPPTPMLSTDARASAATAPAMPPTSFGQQPKQPAFVLSKTKNKPPNPNLGKWEKHTKGIGMKLLSKMGYGGSGGLGSDRRARRKLQKLKEEQAKGPQTDAAATADANNKDAKPEGEGKTELQQQIEARLQAQKAAAEAAATQSAAPTIIEVKKGISRPIEVVVRPANMGLGFGDFKEASQLKSNRKIEAEVRGMEGELDDNKKKKQQQKKKKRKRRTQRGDDHDDSDHVDMDSDTDDEDGDDEFDEDGDEGIESSAYMKDVDDMMAQQQWKKRQRKNPNKKAKKRKAKIVSITDGWGRSAGEGANDADGAVVVDMTGSKQFGDAASREPVPLGSEVLHNISFLMSTYETKMSSSHHFIQSSDRKIEHLQGEVEEMKHRLDEIKDRRSKLTHITDTIDAIEQLLEQSSPNRGVGTSDAALERKARSMVCELASKLSPKERQELNFWQMLAPSLLSPVIERKLRRWKPLTDNLETSRKLIHSIMAFASTDAAAEGEMASLESVVFGMAVFQNQLIPMVQKELDSYKWVPHQQVDHVVDLYELIYKSSKEYRTRQKHQRRTNNRKIQQRQGGAAGDGAASDDEVQVFPMGDVSEDEDHDEHDMDVDGGKGGLKMGHESSTRLPDLAKVVRDQLLHKTIFSKLLSALGSWRPSFDGAASYGSSKTNHRLDLWILPWLIHLNPHGEVPMLLLECKPKIRSALVGLQRHHSSRRAAPGSSGGSDDQQRKQAGEFLKSYTEMLRPWSKMISSKTLQEWTTPIALQQLKLYCSRTPVSLPTDDDDGKQQDWSALQMTFEWHSIGLISNVDFVTLIETELLTNWSMAMFETLSEIDNVEEGRTLAAKSYSTWKSRILCNPLARQQKVSKIKTAQSIEMLRQDPVICRIFYSALRMIQALADGNGKKQQKSSAGMLLEDALHPKQTTFSEAVTKRIERSRLVK